MAGPHEAYEVKDFGHLHWFLGTEIIRNRASNQRWLSQESYVTPMVNKFSLRDDNDKVSKVKTPMPEEMLVSITYQAEANDIS